MCFNSLTQLSPSITSHTSLPLHSSVHSPSHSSASMQGVVPHEGSVRKRVVRACEVCRRKKVKCNGQKPCSHCIAFAEQCIYVDVKDRSAYSRRYVESLELRIARLEKACALAFASGGCGGMCQWSEAKDVMRRASDPGAGTMTKMGIPFEGGQGRPSTPPVMQEVPRGHEVSVSLDPSNNGAVHALVQAHTNVSKLDVNGCDSVSQSSSSQRHSAKRRRPHEVVSLARDARNESKAHATSSKRIRSATLPRNGSVNSAPYILRSETAPPMHTHGVRHTQPPPQPPPQAFQTLPAQLSPVAPFCLVEQHPSLSSTSLSWPINGRAFGEGPVIPSPFPCGVGLDNLWSDHTSSIPVLPSQPQQQPRQAQDSSAMHAQPLEPNQEEMMVGLLKEFMEQQRP